MISDQPMRNHISVILSFIVPVAAILILSTFSTFGLEMALIWVVAIVVTAVIAVVYWYRTLITFTDDGVMVERNTIFKMKKTIPYAKIASVNADRTIFDRIFDTVTLKININSSMNATSANAKFVFKRDIANSVYAEMSEKIHGMTSISEISADQQDVITFSTKDMLLHSLIGVSSFQAVATIFLTLLTLLQLAFFEAFEEPIITILILILIIISCTVLPVVITIIRYYDFRLIRTDDMIWIQNGAIQNYKTSFEVSRINQVRIRRTFFARMFGLACIEVEVVGLGSDNETPTIALLSKEDKITMIMEKILPEFIYDAKPEKQAKGAALVISVNAIIALLISIPASLFVLDIIKQSVLSQYSIDWVDTLFEFMPYVVVIVPVLLVMLGMALSLKNRALDRGEHLFTVVSGLMDRSTNIINYDKVQIVSIRAGMIAKRLGLAKCTVRMLSSVGSKAVVTGYFKESELAAIAERMIEKVNERLPSAIMSS